MEATGARIGEGAEPIESMEWLREFGERYVAAWNSHDPTAVVACVHQDVGLDRSGARRAGDRPRCGRGLRPLLVGGLPRPELR